MPHRTKIVCTIGPASNRLATLCAMGQAGMDVARLNFSHGERANHKKIFENLVAAGRSLGRPYGILQDLQGPKIRVGELPKEGVKLVLGRRITFTTSAQPEEGDVPVTLPALHEDVNPRERILLDDGLLEVEVRRVEGRRIHCEVVHGGTLLSHKGLNLPGTTLRIPALSSKDREDAMFGVKLGVDFIALSFARSPGDVQQLRRLLDRHHGRDIHIIAKIEKREAVERFDKILPLVDGVMIARGDLGIEMPADQVPVVQKQLIAACRERGTPVIVATQMLDSMIHNPRPTRAEVSDVANAVADHADAVMLSGETATGSFPIEAVKMMSQTIATMEQSAFDDLKTLRIEEASGADQSLSAAVRLLADAHRAAPILISAENGKLARFISSMRPETRMFACVRDPHVARTLRLVWGIEPRVASQQKRADAQMQFVLKNLLAKKLIKKGEEVITVSDQRIEILKA